MDESKIFDFGQIVTITSTIPFTPYSKAFEIVDYILGKAHDGAAHLTHGINECRTYVLEQYPQLANAIPTDEIIWTKDINVKLAWLEEQKKIYGDEFFLSPMKEKTR